MLARYEHEKELKERAQEEARQMKLRKKQEEMRQFLAQ